MWVNPILGCGVLQGTPTPEMGDGFKLQLRLTDGNLKLKINQNNLKKQKQNGNFNWQHGGIRKLIRFVAACYSTHIGCVVGRLWCLVHMLQCCHPAQAFLWKITLAMQSQKKIH